MNTSASAATSVACAPDAIPSDQRPGHFALGKRLLKEIALRRIDLRDGLAFELPVTELESIARFIDNERKCCPFMKFAFAIDSGSESVLLSMTGPLGTREVLEAELDLGVPCGCSGGCK